MQWEARGQRFPVAVSRPDSIPTTGKRDEGCALLYFPPFHSQEAGSRSGWGRGCRHHRWLLWCANVSRSCSASSMQDAQRLFSPSFFSTHPPTLCVTVCLLHVCTLQTRSCDTSPRRLAARGIWLTWFFFFFLCLLLRAWTHFPQSGDDTRTHANTHTRTHKCSPISFMSASARDTRKFASLPDLRSGERALAWLWSSDVTIPWPLPQPSPL